MNENKSEHDPKEAGMQTTAEPSGGGSGATEAPRTRQLVRSRHNRWIAGVAGGLASYFNVDSVLIRLGFVVLAVAGGIGFPLYLAAWLLIPKEGEGQSLAETGVSRAQNSLERKERPWIWIVVFVVAAIGFLDWLQEPWDNHGVFWAIVLIAAGVWLYRRDTEERGVPADPSAVPAAEASTGEAAQGTGAEVSSTVQPAPLARPRPPGSYLGRYTIAATLVVVGLMAMLHNAGAFTPRPHHYPAAALVVIGSGLLVGAIWGRSRPLILLGLLLLPLMFAGSTVRFPLHGGVGERSFTPTTPQEVRSSYRLGAGELDLDLTRMTWGDEPVEIDASVGVGEIRVLVPNGVDVEFHGRADGGVIRFFGEERNGSNIDFKSVDDSAGSSRLVIEAQAGFGEIDVSRAPLGLLEVS